MTTNRIGDCASARLSTDAARCLTKNRHICEEKKKNFKHSKNIASSGTVALNVHADHADQGVVAQSIEQGGTAHVASSRSDGHARPGAICGSATTRVR